jgi:hypothetical protein
LNRLDVVLAEVDNCLSNPKMPLSPGNCDLFPRGWSIVTAIASPMSISPKAHDRPKITHMTTSGIFKLKKRTTIGAVDI